MESRSVGIVVQKDSNVIPFPRSFLIKPFVSPATPVSSEHMVRMGKAEWRAAGILKVKGHAINEFNGLIRYLKEDKTL
jgi:hypothetical protein